MKGLFKQDLELTTKVADLHMQRQNIVTSNIANLRTPGYRPKKVEFEKELQNAVGLEAHGSLTTTDDRHMPTTFDAGSFKASLVQQVQPRIVHGEDRVDLDKEMSIMAKNALMYNAITTVIQKQLEGLNKTIIDGGR